MTIPKTTSPYISVRKSSIHNNGIFARTNIPAGTRVIEYVGKKITKSKALRLADETLEKSRQHKDHGAVYLFELNSRHDIDGNVSYNTARFINHSCDPNCEAEIIRGHIWIISKRNIQKGDELTYNYSYDFEHFRDHVCRCGSSKCVGYIIAEEHWPKLKRKLATPKKA